ncbi:ThiF family adenylyltransferase [Amycolatopsis nigrescens]|uniref:ThiF family adenylyltransferase n=1 Tax=Amycolatopsis nigrescens TaxID=381445 RepID=UPI0006853CA8|nr:ThiF family adenylyltransferase [Amycolatopsis nigrescens]
MRPRIKEEHCPVRLGDGWVQIGGRVLGLGAYLRDPDGSVWALLELLDGTRTVGQVVTDLVHLFPDRSAEGVREDIEQLADMGHLEDADEPICTELTSRQRGRYDRGRLLQRWVDPGSRRSSWDFQVELSRARVVVVGMGGVGCTAAMALAMSGVGHLHLVDFDEVELSNLNRQILYTERDLGRRKVDAAVERLRATNSDIEVTGESTRIVSPASLEPLAATCDVLVMCADHPADIWLWANRVCVVTRTDWVFGTYCGPLANMGVYRPGTGPCYECARATERDLQARRPPMEVWSGAPTGPRVVAANAVTAGMVGNQVAWAVLSLITGPSRVRVNHEYGYDLVTLDHAFAFTPDQPHPECRTCRRIA